MLILVELVPATALRIPVSLPPTEAVLVQVTVQVVDVRLFLEGPATEPPIPVGVSTLAATQPQGSSTSLPEALVLSLKEEHYVIKDQYAIVMR